MGKGFKKTVDFFVFSNIYVAVPVCCLAYETLILTGAQSINFNILLVVYFATLFIYCFHRIFPPAYRTGRLKKEHDQTLSERHLWVRDNKNVFIIVTILSLAGLFYSLYFVKPIVTICLIPLGLLSFGYTIPIFRKNPSSPPASGRNLDIRLRDIRRLKIFLIVGVVSFVTVYLPVLSSGVGFRLFSPDLLVLFIERALFVFAITIPFDIRDMEYDGKSDLKTIPLVFGVKRSIRIAAISLFLFALAAICHYFINPMFSLYYVIAMFVSAIITVVIIAKATPKSSEYFYSLLVEGTMIIQCVLVLMANKIEELI